MSDLEIPDDAIKAQQAYDAADAKVREIVAEMPKGIDVAEGRASIPEDLGRRLSVAQLERLERLEQLRDLKWWDTVEDPLKAEAALRKAARTASGEGSAAT